MITYIEDDIKSTVGDFFFLDFYHGRIMLFDVVGSCCKISCNSVCNAFSLFDAAVVIARSNNVLA